LITTTTDISVVVPLCNECANLRELHERLTSVLESLHVDYELVFVDDGSTDETPQLLEELQAVDGSLVVVSLSRNFGHQGAICAGIDHARGDAVIIMDGDLQDPPEVLCALIQTWRQGNEVVYAVRAARKEGFLKRAGYALFYRLLRAVSDIDIPLDSGDFGLMDRKVVEVLKQLPEKERFVRGLRAFVGFRQVGVPYERAARAGGCSKYSFRRLFRLALDGLFSFSDFPVRLVARLGLATAFVAGVMTCVVLTRWLLTQASPDGWQITLNVVLAMSAVQLLSLGLVGETIQRIFREVKGRPGYIVRAVRGTEPSYRTDVARVTGTRVSHEPDA